MIRALLALSAGAEARSLRRVAVLAVLAGITQGIAVLLIVPVLTAVFRHDRPGAVHALIVLVAALLVHAGLMVAATGGGFGASTRVIAAMHRGLGSRLLQLPLSWFGPESQGRASHIAVRGTLFVATAAMDVLVPVIVNVTAPATIAVGACFHDWRIGSALLAAAPVVYLSSRLAARWESAGESRVREARAETDARLLEFAHNQEVLRSAGLAGDYPPLRAAVDRQRRTAGKALWLSVGGMVLQGWVISTILGAVTSLAVWTVTGGGADPVTAVTLIGLVTLAAGPLRVLSSMQSALSQSAAEIDDVRALLETPALPEPDAPRPFPHTAEVRFDHVGFAYDSDGPRVLTDVDLTLPDRSYTALVGPSGSGKTTIVRLLARLWDVSSGTVLIGGIDLRELATADLYAHVSMIFQDVYLFDDTLWANIALGREDATDDEIRDAARRARVTEIAERLPQGWDTRVGEGGRLLSGGERQRVSIARALLRRAPLVLCDEPSSALDASTRRAVTAALAELSREATVVVVAHQLETIRGADRILLLEHGRIAASGTHEELAATDDRYRRFWSLREEAGRWNISADR
ncbi:MAG: ABC transporter ATP-binding protein [Gordonia sp. (in: high G+C Gram-positive bacteria)]|uniref:ABC transporter ATP-binding protein n=1 Tax=Gordonia sp. (in: high G+C Gram-positive bacteria) TaxID=84139 RepID=UPI0039E6D910